LCMLEKWIWGRSRKGSTFNTRLYQLN
jgi:hypothetical protein